MMEEGAARRPATVGSRDVQSLGVPGLLPHWSPDGGQIAYFESDRLHVVDADGGSPRMLGGEEAVFDPYWGGLSWSPDGRWLAAITAGDRRLVLIEVESGMVIPTLVDFISFPNWMN